MLREMAHVNSQRVLSDGAVFSAGLEEFGDAVIDGVRSSFARAGKGVVGGF